jgi:hypothetical protein
VVTSMAEAPFDHTTPETLKRTYINKYSSLKSTLFSFNKPVNSSFLEERNALWSLLPKIR